MKNLKKIFSAGTKNKKPFKLNNLIFLYLYDLNEIYWVKDVAYMTLNKKRINKNISGTVLNERPFRKRNRAKRH